MNLLVPIVMFGWIPAVLAIFAALPARRAVIVAFLVAWLFLPQASFPLRGLPDYDKVTATCVGVLLAAVLFDARRVLRVRLSLLDLPMCLWCLVPLISSMTNGLGLYNGLSGVLRQVIIWGIPYFIGRVYLREPAALRELAIGIVVGGLLYVPLCLWEIRMSPTLHYDVYGFSPSPFTNTLRFGGYRPTVFMHSGLPVGMFMTAASLTGVWLWATGALRRLAGLRLALLVPVLVVTTLLCKSLGALLLLAVGLTALWLTTKLRTSVFVLAVAALPLSYIVIRTIGNWSARELVSVAAAIDADRAASLETRLDNEDMLAAKALHRPVFGWGGWGRHWVYDEHTGQGISVIDGLWILELGRNGLVGLLAMFGALLLPGLLLFARYPGQLWGHPALAAPAALAMILILYSIDNLLNAMPNPIFVLVAGGMAGLLALTPQRQSVGAPRLAGYQSAAEVGKGVAS